MQESLRCVDEVPWAPGRAVRLLLLPEPRHVPWQAHWAALPVRTGSMALRAVHACLKRVVSASAITKQISLFLGDQGTGLALTRAELQVCYLVSHEQLPR